MCKNNFHIQEIISHTKDCPSGVRFTIEIEKIQENVQMQVEKAEMEVSKTLENLLDEPKIISLDESLYVRENCAICCNEKKNEITVCTAGHTYCLECIENLYNISSDTVAGRCPACKRVSNLKKLY